MSTSPIVIIGAGPSGLMAAQKLAEKGYTVHIYEQNKNAARKFLVAGHGGFNLTHHEPIEDFIQRYDQRLLDPIIRSFDNEDTIKWLQEIGVETYVGSSGKIFPTPGIKPITVLQLWIKKLESLGVRISYEYTFTNFAKEELTLTHKSKNQNITFSKLILSLGGGSWKKTGSNAKWIPILESKEIETTPLQAANSGYETTVNYSILEGCVLKNIEVRFENIRKKGEFVFTSYGVEGSPIYYLNRFTRNKKLPLTIHIDLKINQSIDSIKDKIKDKKNISKALKENLNITGTALKLLQMLPKNIFTNPELLSEAIKNYPIEVKSLRPIDEVISTSGGISFNELDSSLALKKYPNIYCIGEMLDWEAPTGGYLLQACFSMGAWVAQQIYEHDKYTSSISGEH